MQTRYRISSLLFLFLTLFQVNAQSCEERFTKIKNQPAILSSMKVQILRRKQLKDHDELVDELKVQLKREMAEQISIKVNTQTDLRVLESQSGFTSNFASRELIESNVVLSTAKFEKCIDEENKKLFLMMHINRVSASNALIKQAESKLQVLNNRIRIVTQEGDSGIYDYISIKERFKMIENHLNNARYLDPNVNDEKAIQLIQEYHSLLQTLRSQPNDNKYSRAFFEINNHLKSDKFVIALELLSELKAQFPQKKELNELESEILNDYRKKMEEVIAFSQASSEYVLVMNELKNYCNYGDCAEKEEKLLKDLGEKCFDAELTIFYGQLKLSNELQASYSLASLREYAVFEPKKFAKAQNDFKEFQISKAILEVENDLNNKLFQTAYYDSKSLRVSYGLNHKEINRLIDKTSTRLYHSEVKKKKRTRRNLFSVAIGVESSTAHFNEMTPLLKIENYNVSLMYSAGVYKKFNYPAYYPGDYPKKTDYIGIKARFMPYGLRYSVSDFASIQTQSRSDYRLDVLIDGSILRGFHYAVGVGVDDAVFTDDPKYLAEFGLKIPFGPVSMQMNCTGLYWNDELLFGAHAGLFLNLDVIRKFNRKDKDAIRNVYDLK